MDRIKEMLDRLSELNEEQLEELKGLIVTEFAELKSQEPSNETVDKMTELADNLDSVRETESTRKAERAEREARAAEAEARINATAEEATDEAKAEETQPEAETTAEPDAPVAEEAKTEEPEAPKVEAEPVAAPAPVAEVAPEVKVEEPAPVVDAIAADAGEPANSPAPETATQTPDVQPDSTPETQPDNNPETEPAQPAEPVEPVADPNAAPDDGNSNNENENQEAPVTADATGQEVVVKAPEDAQPVPREETAAVAITAGADIPGVTSGSEIRDMFQVAEIMTKRLHNSRNASGDGEQSVVASIELEYPDDRVLTMDPKANADKIAAVVSEQAITAAGGFCAPLEVRYDIFGLGSTVRPVKDSLPAFRADRGGIRYVEAPVLANYGTAVGLWTATTDASPGTATKPCLTVTCQNELTAVVDAITLCLQFGNLMTRAFPELVARNNELAAVQFARYAELRLLAKIKAAGTALTAAKDLGAVRDILDQVNRAAASMRYRHRIADDTNLRFVAPSWLRDAFRSDISMSMPHGDPAEQHALADAEIATWFRNRNINVTWTMEGLPTFGGPQQGTGTTLVNWPATVEWDLFPEGTFLVLDGGTLDLGIIRDSTLVGTNDYRMFMETFETVAKMGPESIHVTSTYKPTGEAQALVDTVA